MRDDCLRSIEAHLSLVSKVKAEMVDQIDEAGQMIVHSLKQGHKLMLCGNGGSAADAQHLAAEFVGRFIRERNPLPALALTTDSSALTAIGNDYGFDAVFSRQVDGLGEKGDLLLAISTSGDSANILKAIESARAIGCPTIALTGGSGGQMKSVVDLCLAVPSTETPRIQEMHIMIGHILCDLVDRVFAS